MFIHDYESGRELFDVDIVLTKDEAADLAAYLNRLLTYPELKSVQISRIQGTALAAEVSISLDGTQESA
jgi:hypothetical protein